jgi:RecA/RadA recombinase
MKKTDSPSFETVAAELRARHGGSLRKLEGKPDRRRIPTGIFQIDRVLGGGLPVNRISLVRGRKGSYKTTLALKTIGNYLNACVHCFAPIKHCRCGKTERHDKMCVFIDTEQALDEGYVMRLGIDPSRITLFQPAYGELACEYAEKFAKLPEVGAIIIDSLAALIPNAQLENSYLDGLSRGARAKLINRMCQGMIGYLNRDDQGFPKIAIFVNHVLDKIDSGMFAGDYSPGGDGQSYYSSVVLKVWARKKNESKQDETKTMELERRQELGFLLEHSKVSRSNVAGEAEIHIDPEPSDMCHYGDSNDTVALADWASRIGLIEKDAESYLYKEKKYGKRALENYFVKHPDEYWALRSQVIQGTFRDQ